MEIIIGKLAGFCGGINSAVSKTEKLLVDKEKIYCLGELTHNKQVMEKLEKSGLIVIEKLEDIENNTEVIFRAHGMPKNAYDEAKKRNIKVYDFTCPRVLALHEQIEKESKKGKYIFLLGEEGHPEIVGTMGFADKNNLFLLQTINDVENAIKDLLASKRTELYILSQTTFSLRKFDEIVEKIIQKLEKKGIDIEINNSICEATELRQKETEKISQIVDYMIIIGGKNSSKTRKLYEISEKNCKNAIHIETKDELKNIDFSNYKKIGIMAGASTPKSSIAGVKEYLNELT